MINPKVYECEGCGTLYKIYPGQVYPGDPEYCLNCNKKADKQALDNMPESWQNMKYKGGLFDDI